MDFQLYLVNFGFKGGGGPDESHIAFGLRYRNQSEGDHNDDRYAAAACLEAGGDDDDGDYDYAPAASLEGDDDDDGYDYAPAA
nr:hypothetical protein DVH24_017852 [Ipomoea batatas]GMD82692.1 hypothetical protein DVH24_017852 [Ipomoea batatas]GMD82694.1 hypothetical protein DVH24_017852 [Ipomoea batatas]